MFEIVTDNTADLFDGYYEENPTRRLPFSFTLEDRFYEKDDEYLLNFFMKNSKRANLSKRLKSIRTMRKLCLKRF